MKNNVSIGKVLNEFLTRYPRHFALLFFLLIVEGGAAAISVLAVVPMADFLIDPTLEQPGRITQLVIMGLSGADLRPNLWIFGILFVGANFLRGGLEVAIRYAILRIKYIIVRGLFGDALQTFFKARWGFFSGSNQGKLLNTLNKELITIGDTLGHLATLFAQVIQVIIFIAVPIWLNAQMTLIALSLSLILALPFMLLHRVSYRLGKGNTETANRAMGILNEVLGAARLILGFGRQEEAKKRYLEAFDQHVQVTLLSQTLATAVPKFYQPMAMIAVVVSMANAVQQEVHVAELAAVMWSLLATLPTLSAILQHHISISNFLPSYEQIVSLRESAAEYEEMQGDKSFIKLKRGIELVNIIFTYPGRTSTLMGVNMNIQKGQMVALVGESGSGKSTVTDLILGLQIPEKGQVLIDGISLGDWNQKSFRERVGYVPQDPQLFHSTIRENLLWSFPGAKEGELWEALRLANAELFVKELPEAIDTVVGDRGIRLSGGQRQRIALARALLRKPDLLILDEATSALDSESERLIQESVEHVSNDATILIIAHRLSTIEKADQVYVLNQGRVVEEGSFSTLSVKSGGVLKAMIMSQSAFRQEESKISVN